MKDRLYFSQLAEKLNVDTGAESPAAGGRMTHANVWRKEGGRKALEYLSQYANPGKYFEYDGHADCWLMLAIMYELRMCDINAYIGPFDKTLKLCAYKTGDTPDPGQPVFFDVEEAGDDILLTCKLAPDKGPFDMFFGDIVAPEIPAGKNIYVRLDGQHLLFTFPVSMTYGDKARAVFMDYSGECFCCVSHREDVAVGDVAECPFA